MLGHRSVMCDLRTSDPELNSQDSTIAIDFSHLRPSDDQPLEPVAIRGMASPPPD